MAGWWGGKGEGEGEGGDDEASGGYTGRRVDGGPYMSMCMGDFGELVLVP
jgi:hypothetical protein